MPAARIGQALTLPRLSAPRMHAGSVKPHAAQGAWKSLGAPTQGIGARLHHGCASHAQKVIGLQEARLARVLLRMSGSAARLCPAWAMAALTNFAPWSACVLPSLGGVHAGRCVISGSRAWPIRVAAAGMGRARNRSKPPRTGKRDPFGTPRLAPEATMRLQRITCDASWARAAPAACLPRGRR